MNATETAVPLSLALIVEDCPAQAEHLRQCLERLGINSWTANNLKTAMAAVSNSKFDFFLLDLALPDSTGLATLDSLLSSSPDAVVVVVSASCDDSTIKASMERGAMAYVCKNCDLTGQIASAVDMVLKRLSANGRRRQFVRNAAAVQTALEKIKP